MISPKGIQVYCSDSMPSSTPAMSCAYRQLAMSLTIGLLLVFFYSSLYCQKNGKNITEIRQAFNEINSNSHLSKIELDGEDFLRQIPDGGASLTGYFDNGRLVKIRFWTGFSYGVRQIDYYFRRDSLIFALVTERHFRIIQDSVDLKHTVAGVEGRYYFIKNKLINRKVKGMGFWDSEQESKLVPDSRSYLMLLKKQKKKKTS
jgi:hypothetical protein